MHKLLCLMALPMMGCALTPATSTGFNQASDTVSYQLHLSPTLDPRLTQGMMEAVSDWMVNNPSLQVDVSISSSEECQGGRCITVSAEPRAYLQSSHTTLDGLIAYTEGQANFSSHITLPSDLFDLGLNNLLPVVARHELGHAFGLGHVSDTNAVMYPTTGAADHITCNDRAQFSRIHKVEMLECIPVSPTYQPSPGYNSFQ